MAKENFLDFTFSGKKLSGLSTKYIPVQFDENSDIALGLERDMEAGESTRYRIEPNYFYDKWSDGLPLEIHLVKDPCTYSTQSEKEITKSEIRELTSWLTSSHFPKWLKFEYDINDENDATRYMGWFNNIEPFVVGGMVYGLKLYFKCTTPFAYTNDITNEITVSNYKNLTVKNNSDELFSYCYPTIQIYPNANGEIFLCNLSDATIYAEGTLTAGSTGYFNSLLDVVDNYAKLNGYTVEYVAPSGSAQNIIPLCNNTAVQFYLVDTYGNKIKCTAFYINDSTKKYRIIENGFVHFTVYKNLQVYIDTQKLTINDELGRMITYDKLGVNDVDHMYWLRLLNGDNTLLLSGNCKFTIIHIESRKVGE